MKMHTVKQLALLSGVSVRTLHYYDQIGLLTPQRSGANGYRLYGAAELLRLQQILLYREMDLPLSEIDSLLRQQDSSRIETLQTHRATLVARADRYRQLIASIDHSIASLAGEISMQPEQLYQGFTAEKQAEHEAWLIDRYGPSMREEIAQARLRASQTTEDVHFGRMQELAEIEAALARHCRAGLSAASPQLDLLLDRHRSWVAAMWGKPCAPEAYAGLADLYASHPDFRARYETLSTGLSDYLPEAMRAYVARVSLVIDDA